MFEEEALWAEWGESDSHQGSSIEETIPITMSCNRVGLSVSTGTSETMSSAEAVENEDLGSVKSRGDG